MKNYKLIIFAILVVMNLSTLLISLHDNKIGYAKFLAVNEVVLLFGLFDAYKGGKTMKPIISEKDEYIRMNVYLATVQIAIVVSVVVAYFTF